MSPVVSSAATSRGVCEDPNRDAMIEASGVALDYIPNFSDESSPNVVVVAVSLSANGSVTNEKIRKSSGNDAMDNSAMKAARRTLYTPRLENCRASPGVFLFRARFDGPPTSTSEHDPGD